MKIALPVLGFLLGWVFGIGVLLGLLLGLYLMWRQWDDAMRTFEGDGEHDGSPWYRMARRIR